MNTQFRILWREFLFRTVDIELLSAQGDAGKLIRQVGMLLTLFSFWVAFAAYRYAIPHRPHAPQLIKAWQDEHFLISTTMLVVGLLAVLSWDSTFPDRRDVLVLAPLPIRVRTVFLAKVAALATALGAAIAVVNVFPGIIWPFVALIPSYPQMLDALVHPELYHAIAAYWVTMISSGLFIYCAVLTVQGIAALLPRRHFLRLSGVLQIAAFCLFVSTYFLEPSLATPRALTAPENQTVLAWLPSYWFLSLLQQLNGCMHPAMVPLLPKALAGLAIAFLGAFAAFLSGLRSYRRIVEEPDIVPGYRGAEWLRFLGSSVNAAILWFSARALLRSRRHRVILAFYLGVGFSIALSVANVVPMWKQANVPFMFSSIAMMLFAIVGTRVVFAMPLNLQANWIFRTTAIRRPSDYLKATSRSLLAIAALPVWLVSAAVFLSIWPLRQAAIHLAILALIGVIVAEVSLIRFPKIPFTCSYMPGQSNFYWAFMGTYVIMFFILRGVELERRALDNPALLTRILLILWCAAIAAMWSASRKGVLLFEEIEPESFTTLRIYEEGMLPKK